MYYVSLCHFAYTYLKNKEDTEEIVSDIFFTLWKNRDHLVIDKNVKAYLYIAVKNASLAQIKKKKPDFVDLDNSELRLSKSITESTTPDRIIEIAQLRHQIDQAVDRLPARCRQVFIMNRVDHLKYREISEILNLSEKTVENHIIKALQLLRQSLPRLMKETR